MWATRLDPVMSRKIDAVVCHECGNFFTPSGLRMHEGSEKCRLTKIARPLREATVEECKRMSSLGKAPIVKNVASALFRRNLEGLCGLEKASTRLMHSDMDCTVLDEYWVHEWVFRIWEKHNTEGYTRKAYALLESLNEMSQDQRDREIGLIMLGMYG